MRITVLLWAVGLALWGFGRLDSGGPLVLAAEPEAFDPKATMPQRAAQPKAQELQKAEKLVEEVFGRQIAKAKTPQEKQQLAQEILTTAREEQDSVLRYATLQAARRLAVDALDGKLGLEIVREMVAGYDPLEAMSVKDRLAEADRLWQ
ncbi:MAG: hypothetical protein NZ602_17500, partial [Thermoguttaceae bacterium]|nr:hypothetical protein [Thermoguttaceae bacterium]